MTVTKGYFIDLKSLDRFEFQFNPDNIQDSKESEIEQIKIPGASHPRVSWGIWWGSYDQLRSTNRSTQRERRS